MSEATRDALEQALATHISDEAGKQYLVTGYVIGTSVTSFEGEPTGGHAYVFETPVNQPIHVSRGLSVLTEEWASTVDYVIEMGDDD